MSNVIPIVTEHAIAEWLRKYPSKFMACRQGHNFPKLIPGKKDFKRTWIERDPETSARTIHQLCTCGRERWRLLNANNTLGGRSWKYKDPPGYSQPPGYGLTRGDFADVYWTEIVAEYDESEARIEQATRKVT
jgi:hypothetical protein